MEQRLFTTDFGFSDLTRWFYGPWHIDGTALDTVTAAATGRLGDPPGSAASALRSDSVRLLESPLTTEDIATLWRAASNQGCGTTYFGIDARDWLRQIITVCGEQLRHLGMDDERPLPRSEPKKSAEQVLREILCVRDKLTSPTDSTRHMDPTGAVAEALEGVVSTVDDDLGFRLFLRVLNTYRIPLSQDQYTRFQRLGEYFGYGEFHVHDVEWLTRQP
ncbi:hypothetical protein [Streptomyces xanthochromogenes]|uniref:hypothetical protein n=1 Tax=Streptomyces xanthochromogenes TaxID=67384 RepID=UPI002F4043FC